VAQIEGRLQTQQKLLGKIVGLMFPTLFGCLQGHELTRVRGWNKNLPTQLLGALPKRSWLKRLRRLGLEILISIWRHTQDQSASTPSRWQWRWVVDDSVFRKYGKHFRLVGRWWSGQFKHPVAGIDGVLLLVVIGDGKLIIPVDFAIRRANPKGPGQRCQDKLQLTQKMLDERLFRILKHLLAAEACQARSEDAYYGHFVLRLIAGLTLFYTSRFIFKGQVTMEEIVFTLKHYWMTVNYEPFELYAIA
jgi:hypothetical protein